MLSPSRYTLLAFKAYVRSHPQLRFCPGVGGTPSAAAVYAAASASSPGEASPAAALGPDGVCKTVIKVEKSSAKKCVCSNCKTSFW